MKIVFKTAIDKYKGKFPTDFSVVPRQGEFVKVDKPYMNQTLPFDKLQVVSVTYTRDIIEVELHLSDLQARANKECDLGVFI